MSVRRLISVSALQSLRQHNAPIVGRNVHTLVRRLPRQQQLQCPYQHTLVRRRHASTFASSFRTLFRQNPFSMTLVAVSLVVGVGALMYVNYMYQTYILGAFHKYPEEVAKKLRRALYYTNTDVQAQNALKYYRQALEVADELGMDPFSDEIMGIKIQVAKLMEDLKQYDKAAQVLDIVRRDALEWIRLYGDKEQNRVKRTRVLAKCVAISVKLGELCASPELYDREKAEQLLVWAVETSLKELQRRNNIRATEGLSEEELIEREGPWMTPSETGAALEALAHRYEENDQHYLASPLFLQALTLYPTTDCHTVVLMNNLASSLAQQSPRAAQVVADFASSRNIISPSASQTTIPVTRESLVQNAGVWAQKALDVAAKIQPPDRSEECDVGCAVATHNLGEFAEMSGLKNEAKKRYEEAISIAKAVGFQKGVSQSQARLQALQTG